jgi:hypothetical protein
VQTILDSIDDRNLSGGVEAEVNVARFLLQNRAVQTTIQQALASDSVVEFVPSAACYFAVPPLPSHDGTFAPPVALESPMNAVH